MSKTIRFTRGQRHSITDAYRQVSLAIGYMESIDIILKHLQRPPNVRTPPDARNIHIAIMAVKEDVRSLDLSMRMALFLPNMSAEVFDMWLESLNRIYREVEFMQTDMRKLGYARRHRTAAMGALISIAFNFAASINTAMSFVEQAEVG